ncbi:hypothetical protein [Actinomadura sp. K4S16]|uniref:hypothetical protein n=1 Tax=Actinomadura sp. K4S16 TaxID=1316147 RepID=UPI0011EDF917|nr:hypothetical protein [Actinomadura sp. K4S16]
MNVANVLIGLGLLVSFAGVGLCASGVLRGRFQRLVAGLEVGGVGEVLACVGWALGGDSAGVVVSGIFGFGSIVGAMWLRSRSRRRSEAKEAR